MSIDGTLRFELLLTCWVRAARLDLQEARPEKASSVNQILWKSGISDRDCMSIFRFLFCAVLNVLGYWSLTFLPADDVTPCPRCGPNTATRGKTCFDFKGIIAP
jgi:hypothetical protein